MLKYIASFSKNVQDLMSCNVYQVKKIYLEIYISQKIRLCNGIFKGKFQFNLQAKSITFLGWKFKSAILIFFLFFP